jgi:ligand-binding sensor domain-containing protein
MKSQTLAIFLINISVLFGQDVYNWQNYTDMKNVSSCQTSDNGLWAATSGGAFFYNFNTGKYLTLHKNDGLVGSSLKSVTVDSEGKIWFGGDEGAINVYLPDSKQIKTILDIYNDKEQSNKSITDLESAGDTIFVCTDFGLSLVDLKNYIFYDTFFKYGTFQPYIKVNSSLKAGLIYLATNAGVAIQKEGAQNLSAPESWNTYTVQNGLPSNTVTKIIKMNGSVIAATDKGISIMTDSVWTPFLTQFNNVAINDIFLRNDSLFISVGK